MRQHFQAGGVQSILAAAGVLFTHLIVLDPKFIRILQNTHFGRSGTVFLTAVNQMRGGLARKSTFWWKIINLCCGKTYANTGRRGSVVFRAKRVGWAKGEGLWKAKATSEKAVF